MKKKKQEMPEWERKLFKRFYIALISIAVVTIGAVLYIALFCKGGA